MFRVQLRLVFCLATAMGLWSGQVKAQQDPLYTQYYFNRVLVNPAYAGMEQAVNISAAYRESHSGFEGAPNTQALTVHAPIQKQYMGVGARFTRDNISVHDWYTFHALYDYQLGLGGGRLSLGLEAGIVSYSADYQGLRTSARSNGQVDAAIPEGQPSIIVPDFSFGLYFDEGENFVGLAAYHLNQPELSLEDVASAEDRAAYARHYYLMAGTGLPLNDQIMLEPSVYARFVSGADVLADINLMAQYKELVGLGAAYRTNQVLALMIRGQVTERIGLGYSYDMFNGGAAYDLGASHEVMLRYRIPLEEPARQKIIDPRYYY